MKKYLSLQVIGILVAALLLGFFDLPNTIQKTILPATPASILNAGIQLGLDLQGGTQLDYKIDLSNVPDSDRENIVEGVKEVINRRVNGLGVSEPYIYTSNVGNEFHIIAELAGLTNIEDAKKTVGKIIQLEFKEQKTEIEPEKKEEIRIQSQTVLETLLKNPQSDLKTIADEENKKLSGKVEFIEDSEYSYADQLSGKISEKAFDSSLKNGDIIPELIEIKEEDGNYGVNESGQFVTQKGYAIYKLLEKIDNSERKIDHPKEVQASHILIQYKGVKDVPETVTRTEDEAKKRAEEILAKAKSEGADFAALAKEYSEDQGSKENGGDLGFFTAEKMVKEFSDAAFAMQKDQISDIVKSQYGFHIIKVANIKELSTETKIEPKVKLARIFYSTTPDAWKDTGLTGKHFVHADVTFQQGGNPYVSIKFNDEGAKLFEQITERNIGKQVAIFVGGDLISAPRVNEKISGGSAQISGNFSIDEATNLSRDLNTGAIPAPITLAGQYTIGASLGQIALDKSMKAGILGLIAVILFMILYYRLPGLVATIALFMYGVILLFLIKSALPLSYALFLSSILFVLIVSKVMKSNESGGEKMIAFILACFILFFTTLVLITPVVLTLAGIAGVILSIGMAVDANILIFERIKEEIHEGKPLTSAVEIGFDRAWSSIRDSNFSSLITCAILFYFGTSLIQGFAFNLAMGILVSMFTAITVTHTLLRWMIKTSWGQKLALYAPRKKKEKKTFDFIARSKTWFTISGSLIVVSMMALIIFGTNFGLDFTGGSLMELKFEDQTVTTDRVSNALQNLEGKTFSDVVAQIKLDETNSEPQNQTITLGAPLVMPTDQQSFIIRTKYIDNETHEIIKKTLNEKLGNFEEPRFTTIGPTIGKTLKIRALYALILALIMIVLYIAFAFRRIPKRINPWRFGICAILALIHDVIITIGAYLIVGKFLNVEIDALFITALLTIIGFSVHDTIVVFDRIRENLKFQTRNETFEDITNKALNQTLARSINTSLSTLLTILTLFIFGAPTIRFFAFALLVGITAGTYSSIFVASPLLVAWRNWDIKKQQK
ncbi:protein translocase subunit SecF [Candidatus Peregrinibacteria bacterium]|nr:protein translocase subunit SecF [Candidatus Peregrinibacteria bacterium]